MQGLGETSPLTAFETLPELQVEIARRAHRSFPGTFVPKLDRRFGSGTTVLYSPTLYTQALLAFKDSTHVLS
jgi:hypothetical protein